MYMRNRYYDPKTGQFTQPDPIGLAGGLNAFGFANGDPVSFSDPYGLRVDSIHVRGSRAFRRTVIQGLMTLANEQPWFRRAYLAVAGSSRHNIYITEGRCRRSATSNCEWSGGRRTAHINLAPNSNVLELMNSAGHEMLHAFGDLEYANPGLTGIDRECGRADGPMNGCIAYYDNLNRDVLGLPNVPDDDGAIYAQRRGLRMWNPDNPMTREHRPARQ
jgi:hypothetical protein